MKPRFRRRKYSCGLLGLASRLRMLRHQDASIHQSAPDEPRAYRRLAYPAAFSQRYSRESTKRASCRRGGPGSTYRLWVVCRLHTLAVKEETHTRNVLALAITERIHEFLELGSPLDLEEHLVVVIRHLDIKVLDGGGGGIGASVSTSVLSVVRHVDDLGVGDAR